MIKILILEPPEEIIWDEHKDFCTKDPWTASLTMDEASDGECLVAGKCVSQVAPWTRNTL